VTKPVPAGSPAGQQIPVQNVLPGPELLSEELVVGSDDPQAQAEVILLGIGRADRRSRRRDLTRLHASFALKLCSARGPHRLVRVLWMLRVTRPWLACSSPQLTGAVFGDSAPGHQNGGGVSKELPVVSFAVQPDGVVLGGARCSSGSRRRMSSARTGVSRGQEVDHVEVGAVQGGHRDRLRSAGWGWLGVHRPLGMQARRSRTRAGHECGVLPMQRERRNFGTVSGLPAAPGARWRRTNRWQRPVLPVDQQRPRKQPSLR
jgi:hypothetical protein